MEFNYISNFFKHISIYFIFLFFLLSCNNEEETLFESNDTVDENTNVLGEDIGENIIVDDVFIVSSGSVKELDVLSNDDLSEFTNVVITSISQPVYGEINSTGNNSFEYIAPDISSEIIDNFTYSVEATKSDGGKISLDGEVNVEVVHQNYLITLEAKEELKVRFENGYILRSGFSDDITKVKEFTSRFLSNPSEYRPKFGESGSLPPRGQYLHTSAVYAYVMDDVNLANAIANEIVETVKTNPLNTAFWNNSNVVRWDTEYALWIQTSKIKKTLDSYYFVKYLQTTLTNQEISTIESWFNRFADLAYRALKDRLDSYLGNNWHINGESKFIYNDLYPVSQASTPNPVQDAEGKDLVEFTMSWAQDIYNNRQWDCVAYIHSMAVKNNDIERENWARQFVKSFLKYAVFADGTMAELWRNKDDDPTRGVFYSYVSLGAVIQIAHADAMANHFPGDKLYDYKTKEGIVNGSTNLTDSGYVGGSTTDGVTEKSLYTVLKAQSNYLRSSANGGWNDLRFFRKSNNTVVPLSTVGKRQPSTIPAIANLYYKDNDLSDFYMYNTAVGYPAKQIINEGYIASMWEANEDMGSWGNLIFGSIWYEQENNFFN
ncbi:Ig-like domain-containing protein [Hyunsoonleella pacifica]|uniref:Uncharacterized protein n=1 Tax=Hyunsoonleella pacifica TaxID=1080224 RepID=A0A4Q9FS72_9FLAO|nr:Ig-like domain-containing protein [Hyunsoonleella pacifica]TBN18656.1 hypothetical protein EYD46_00900 [Hyunsoonleella pacifica]GGD03591.1 hypothetical protein GCM10011368_01790 [Hyunsoonleella pacifica]